uniref:Uncharacterized protein n=1 Tax=Anguilla anguilla TaxID=7936 RepID=A0A0E9SC43_ANGAN
MPLINQDFILSTNNFYSSECVFIWYAA